MEQVAKGQDAQAFESGVLSFRDKRQVFYRGIERDGNRRPGL